MIAASARRLDGARQRLSGRCELARLRERLPALLIDTPAEGRLAGALSAQWTRSGVAVFVLGAAAHAPEVVVKAARQPGAAASLVRQQATLTQLHAVAALGDWRALLPCPLAQRVAGAVKVVVETALPGRPATAMDEAALSGVLGAILPLHSRTGSAVIVGASQLARWVVEPITRLVALDGLSNDRRATLPELRDRLASELTGAELQTSWIHGDYWLANVLVDAQGAVTGIVDWDRAAPDELALHDVLHLLLYARKLRTRQPLGAVVARQLRAPEWSLEERRALEHVDERSASMTDASAVMLYWLRHVAENLRRDPAYATNVAWLRGNVLPVLDALRGTP